MRRLFVSICVMGILAILMTGLVCAETMEEIKARARAEARQEMGLDKPAKPVAQQETGRSPMSTGQRLLQQLILLAIGLAVIPATIAKVKGRSFIAWWVLGLLFFPVVFFISLFIKKWPKPGQVATGDAIQGTKGE
ncbi:hypothetical protein ACFL5E_02585 [Candidatus Omnitrophota bacterium]